MSTISGAATLGEARRFGMAGSKKVEFCHQYAKEGIINVYSKKCAHSGFSTTPHFGTIGSEKAEFCRGHAKDRTINVRTKRCGHPWVQHPVAFGHGWGQEARFLLQARRGGNACRHRR